MEIRYILAVLLLILFIGILGYLGKLALNILEELSAGKKRKRADRYSL